MSLVLLPSQKAIKEDRFAAPIMEFYVMRRAMHISLHPFFAIVPPAFKTEFNHSHGEIVASIFVDNFFFGLTDIATFPALKLQD